MGRRDGDGWPGASGDGRREELRAALFVDFDNLCIGFGDLSPLAAHRFATQPARWLAWFESGAHARGDGDDADGEPPVRRRVLVRRCYLNPVTFGQYRADYTRAAFSVVDCPPLTQRGKTSADVYMVMDVLDALDHATGYDEFIILSADADFTPVLLRLRAFDRRTAIVATNATAAAYRAACDRVVPFERFFEEALGIGPEPSTGGQHHQAHLGQAPTEEDDDDGNGGGAAGHDPLLTRVAAALRERVEAGGPLGPREVPPAVFATFPEFRNSDWFGRFSLKALMLRLLELEPGLVVLGDLNGAWTVTLRDEAPGGGAPGGRDGWGPEPYSTDPGTPGRPVGAADGGDAGGLAGPARRGLPEDPEASFRRFADVAGVPALGPAEYACLFAALAEAAAVPDLDFNGRAGRVRDALQAGGVEVSRAQVNFVLNAFRRNRVEIARHDAGSLAAAWRDITLAALRDAEGPLSGEELRLVDRWLLGGVPAGSTAPAGDGAAGPP